MQIENLKLFCDLVETQNFTRAAKRNFITASAVTQMLHHLERDAGEMLILRGSHKFQLTRAGETYYQYASEIVRLHADAVRRILQLASDSIIELAACHSIFLHQLPPLLKQFQRDFAGVQINVRHGLIDRVHGQVLENTVDLGLVCYPRRLTGLTVDPFRHERLVLVCHPQHPLATRATVTVPDLKGCQFVAWNEIRWSPFLRNVPNCQRHLFAPHRECDQVEPVKRMVEMDAGVAILPEALVLPEVADHRLAAVPFANSDRTEPLAVIYRKQKQLTPAMINFINALKQPVPILSASNAFYVQTVARYDLVTFLTSGYQTVSNNRGQSPVGTPSITGIDNDIPTQLAVHLTPITNAIGYEVQVLIAGVWTTVKFSPQARSIILIGLTTGQVVQVRARALGGSTGESAWSVPSSSIVD